MLIINVSIICRNVLYLVLPAFDTNLHPIADKVNDLVVCKKKKLSGKRIQLIAYSKQRTRP